MDGEQPPPSPDTMATEAALSATHPAMVDTFINTQTLALKTHIQPTGVGGLLFNIQIVFEY